MIVCVQLFPSLPSSRDLPTQSPKASSRLGFWLSHLSSQMEWEMVTHSSILAWRILWTEEPGGLQSMGLQKSWTWRSEVRRFLKVSQVKPRISECGLWGFWPEGPLSPALYSQPSPSFFRHCSVDHKAPGNTVVLHQARHLGKRRWKWSHVQPRCPQGQHQLGPLSRTEMRETVLSSHLWSHRALLLHNTSRVVL